MSKHTRRPPHRRSQELLEALKEAVAALELHGMSLGVRLVCLRAIAKAEGCRTARRFDE